MNSTPSNGPRPKPDPELAALEAALQSLRPQADWLDRDRLMYRAGRASAMGKAGRQSTAGRTALFWPLATAASLLLAVTFGALLLQGEMAASSRSVSPLARKSSQEAPPRSTTAPAKATQPAPTPAVLAAAPDAPKSRAGARPKKIRDDYLRLRQLVISKGPDAFVEQASPGVDSNDGGTTTDSPASTPQPASPYRDVLKRLLDS
jgi:hypothetical protein